MKGEYGLNIKGQRKTYQDNEEGLSVMYVTPTKCTYKTTYNLYCF
jgi:hypothetical protein